MEDLSTLRAQIDTIDKSMAELFEQRMKTVRMIAEYKQKNHIPLRDEAREAALTEKNRGLISDNTLEEYYALFLREIIELSCTYQKKLMKETE